MDYYEIWCNLKDGSKDLVFCENLDRYLSFLQSNGMIAGFRITRRKLGLGPAEFGEFHITMEVKNLEQLEGAFQLVGTRSGEVENLHRAVFTMVTDFKAALYRDFPDAFRTPHHKSGGG